MQDILTRMWTCVKCNFRVKRYRWRSVLSEKAMGARTEVRTGLSPSPASWCSLLRRRLRLDAAHFLLTQSLQLVKPDF